MAEEVYITPDYFETLQIPVLQGELALGTWQGIYLFEHRTAPHRRSVVLHLMGED